MSRRAVACPACGAKTKQQVETTPTGNETNADSRKAMLIKTLIIGLVCAAVFGFLGFGVENMSGGWLYNLTYLLRLNNPTISLIAKALFWLSLPVVIIPFAMLQQLESE